MIVGCARVGTDGQSLESRRSALTVSGAKDLHNKLTRFR
jgi:hypothetical protein